jgi:hypothetical protein
MNNKRTAFILSVEANKIKLTTFENLQAGASPFSPFLHKSSKNHFSDFLFEEQLKIKPLTLNAK